MDDDAIIGAIQTYLGCHNYENFKALVDLIQTNYGGSTYDVKLLLNDLNVTSIDDEEMMFAARYIKDHGTDTIPFIFLVFKGFTYDVHSSILLDRLLDLYDRIYGKQSKMYNN